MRKYFTKFIDLLYPKHCLECWTQGSYCCSTCTKLLIPHSESCPVCHQVSVQYQVCVWCKAKGSDLEGIIINFQYTDLCKAMVYQLKYNHVFSLAQTIAQKMSLLLRTHPIYPQDWLGISYIPSHRLRKHWIKGYNQAELIASHIASELSLPLLRISKRKRYTKSQVTLTRKKRIKNLSNAFTLVPECKHLLKNTKILILVDDITTTGTTIVEVAKCIKKQHPHIKIRGAVFARHGA